MSCGRCRGRSSCGCWRRRCLHLQGADVDASVNDPCITGTTLIIQRRRSEVRVAHINSRTTGQQVMSEGRAAVVLERAEHRIGVDLVAGRSQEATAVIAAEIVAVRGNCASGDIGA